MRSKLMHLSFLIFLALFSGTGTAYASFSAEQEAYISFPGDPEFDAGRVDAAATAVTVQNLFSKESSGPRFLRDWSRSFGPDSLGAIITAEVAFSGQDRAYLKFTILLDPSLGIEELLFPFHFFT